MTKFLAPASPGCDSRLCGGAKGIQVVVSTMGAAGSVLLRRLNRQHKNTSMEAGTAQLIMQDESPLYATAEASGCAVDRAALYHAPLVVRRYLLRLPVEAGVGSNDPDSIKWEEYEVLR